jgi:hypothetical protein
MKAVNAILSTVGLLVLALSMPSWAQTRTLPTQTITLSGTVETIDHNKRVVNINMPDGKFQTIDVPPARSGSMNSRSGTRCRSRITTPSRRD